VKLRIAAASLATLSLGLGMSSQVTASADPGDAGPTSATTAAEADQALTDAQAVVDNNPATGPTDGRDATMVLRDLIMARASMTDTERAAADRILGRPSQSGDEDYYGAGNERPRHCGPNVCVHYALNGPERLMGASRVDDSGVNGVPDYVERVLTTTEHVHDTYVAAGYRQPKSDGTRGGGSGLTDVYLAQIGNKNLYGYCTSEDNAPSGGPWDLAAYCVLDNDYKPEEFPTNTPTQNMQVTAAHEYFHAVQYAYDAYEDTWFMEATATWAEDELYDNVNDNWNYLDRGQMAQPTRPLDSSAGLGVYGNWVFFRYLTEKYSDTAGGLPVLVRSMWRRADGTAGAQDQYSLQAVRNTVAAEGGSLSTQYARFADGNRRPGRTYDEGSAYPASPLRLGTSKLSSGKPRSAWKSATLDHLTSSTARFKPKSLSSKKWRLKVQVDLADKARGSLAVVSTYLKSGSVSTKFVPLSKRGNGSLRTPFSSGTVSKVEVTLVNASTRFRSCWTDGTQPQYSCLGVPRDENLTQKVRGTATR
jgi:hypothetical protein